MSENLHAGHRERMIKKFLSSNDLPEHEILEIILYSVIPRKDTNGVSHTILNVFGSLANVFSAKKEELMSIDGVGEKVASQLILIGKLSEVVSKKKDCDLKEDKSWISFDKHKQELFDFFKNFKEEHLLIILLDKKRNRIAKFDIQASGNDKVETEISTIAKSLAIYHPKYVITCHNHPSGIIEPSQIDDINTKKVYMLCELHGATLIDNIIISENNGYSYFLKKRMEYVKNQSDLSKLLIMADKQEIINE